jgi:hypothetical protein
MRIIQVIVLTAYAMATFTQNAPRKAIAIQLEAVRFLAGATASILS